MCPPRLYSHPSWFGIIVALFHEYFIEFRSWTVLSFDDYLFFPITKLQDRNPIRIMTPQLDGALRMVGWLQFLHQLNFLGKHESADLLLKFASSWNVVAVHERGVRNTDRVFSLRMESNASHVCSGFSLFTQIMRSTFRCFSIATSKCERYMTERMKMSHKSFQLGTTTII